MKTLGRMKFMLTSLLFVFAVGLSGVTLSHAASVTNSILNDKDTTINRDGTITTKVKITDELRRQCEEAGVKLEDVINPEDPTVVLDSDDLDAIEENTGITLKKRDLPNLAQVMAASNYLEPSSYQEVTKRHTIAINTNVSQNAMQTFCYGSDGYLYITQNSTGTVTISRYLLNGSGTYIYYDSMTIQNAGHAQTLEQFNYGGKTYLLVTLGENVVNNLYWSTQIGCVEYQPGANLLSNNLKRYVGFAVGNGSSPIKRVDAALSSDKSKIIVWKKNENNKTEISGYDFSEFKQVLLGGTALQVSINNLSCEYSFGDNSDSSLKFPQSFQGIELSNMVNGVSSIYIVGGKETKNDKKTMVIARYNSNGNLKKYYGIKHSDLPGIKEMEGIHINGDYLDVGIVPAPEYKGWYVDKSTQHISTIDKSIFK